MSWWIFKTHNCRLPRWTPLATYYLYIAGVYNNSWQHLVTRLYNWPKIPRVPFLLQARKIIHYTCITIPKHGADPLQLAVVTCPFNYTLCICRHILLYTCVCVMNSYIMQACILQLLRCMPAYTVYQVVPIAHCHHSCNYSMGMMESHVNSDSIYIPCETPPF